MTVSTTNPARDLYTPSRRTGPDADVRVEVVRVASVGWRVAAVASTAAGRRLIFDRVVGTEGRAVAAKREAERVAEGVVGGA